MLSFIIWIVSSLKCELCSFKKTQLFCLMFWHSFWCCHLFHIWAWLYKFFIHWKKLFSPAFCFSEAVINPKEAYTNRRLAYGFLNWFLFLANIFHFPNCGADLIAVVMLTLIFCASGRHHFMGLQEKRDVSSVVPSQG